MKANGQRKIEKIGEKDKKRKKREQVRVRTRKSKAKEKRARERERERDLLPSGRSPSGQMRMGSGL